MSPQAISTLTCGLELSASQATYGLASNGQFQSSSALSRINSEGTSTYSNTVLDRMAGIYVTNPNGTLVASAGNTLALNARVRVNFFQAIIE